MKKLLLFLLVVFSISLFSQEEGMQQEMSAEQQAWMEFMTPGEMHKFLEHGVGEWNVASKFWMTPEAEPMESEGTAVGEMLMGGRYLHMKHTGTFMGMPFEGVSLEGYDNAKEKFISIWIDNMGTGITRTTGTLDKEKKQIVYEGTATDPMTKGDEWFKQVMTIVDENNMHLEIFGKIEDGSEFKFMDMAFTRK